MNRHCPKDSKLAKELVDKYVIYDPKKGTFIRKKSEGYAGREAGPVSGSALGIRLGGHGFTLNQVAYIAMKGQLPPRRLIHKDNDKFNFKWKNIILTKTRKRGATENRSLAKELVNGQEMYVDGSRSVQPKTPANALRLSGYCKGCRWYSNCLNHNMKLPCRGKCTMLDNVIPK